MSEKIVRAVEVTVGVYGIYCFFCNFRKESIDHEVCVLFNNVKLEKEKFYCFRCPECIEKFPSEGK